MRSSTCSTASSDEVFDKSEYKLVSNQDRKIEKSCLVEDEILLRGEPISKVNRKDSVFLSLGKSQKPLYSTSSAFKGNYVWGNGKAENGLGSTEDLKNDKCCLDVDVEKAGYIRQGDCARSEHLKGVKVGRNEPVNGCQSESSKKDSSKRGSIKKRSSLDSWYSLNRESDNRRSSATLSENPCAHGEKARKDNVLLIANDESVGVKKESVISRRWKRQYSSILLIARSLRKFLTMEHEELITELPQIEKLSNQDRLRLAHKRRMNQLRKWSSYEKELLSGRKSKFDGGKKRGKRSVVFENSVVLLEAAARGDVAEVRRLLESGVDPNVCNEDGLTALHQCCIDDNEEMLKLLIEFGADVNAIDSEQWTPLHASATCGHLHLVRHLITNGANLLAVNAEGNMPYDICDYEATLDYIESEMAKRGVTQELIEEIRSLPETNMLHDMHIIASQDGDLEFQDKDGATPLHIAAANGYVRVAEFLLENHASVDAQDKDLFTPMHAAACWGNGDVLELLVQNGADLNAKTKNNETPYAICEDPEIKERIIQLKNEQETRLQDAARRKVRRTQSSNSRTQSIRRTSQRDKGLTSKRDAAEEAQKLLSARTSPTKGQTSTAPGSLEGPPKFTEMASPGEINKSHTKSVQNAPQHDDDNSKASNDGYTVLNNSININKENEHNTSNNTDQDGELYKSYQAALSKGQDCLSQINLTHQNLQSINVRSGGIQELKTNNLEQDSFRKNSGPFIAPSSNDNKSLPEGNKVIISPSNSSVNSVVQIDSNANLPKPEINPTIDNKLSIDSKKLIKGKNDQLNGNSKIDIHVSVTISTNGQQTSSEEPHGNSSLGGNLATATTDESSSDPVLAPLPALMPSVMNSSFCRQGTLPDLKKHRTLSRGSQNSPLTTRPRLHTSLNRASGSLEYSTGNDYQMSLVDRAEGVDNIDRDDDDSGSLVNGFVQRSSDNADRIFDDTNAQEHEVFAFSSERPQALLSANHSAVELLNEDDNHVARLSGPKKVHFMPMQEKGSWKTAYSNATAPFFWDGRTFDSALSNVGFSVDSSCFRDHGSSGKEISQFDSVAFIASAFKNTPSLAQLHGHTLFQTNDAFLYYPLCQTYPSNCIESINPLTGSKIEMASKNDAPSSPTACVRRFRDPEVMAGHGNDHEDGKRCCIIV